MTRLNSGDVEWFIGPPGVCRFMKKRACSRQYYEANSNFKSVFVIRTFKLNGKYRA